MHRDALAEYHLALAELNLHDAEAALATLEPGSAEYALVAEAVERLRGERLAAAADMEPHAPR